MGHEPGPRVAMRRGDAADPRELIRYQLLIVADHLPKPVP
jgi:hypothetical protein